MSKNNSDLQAFRVAIYARYSSDLQNASSIDDQNRVCTALAKQNGWQVVVHHADRAISGASLLRPQLQTMLEQARLGLFDGVVAEALDRLSRDQEDIAGLYKRLRFQGVRLVTCSEGEISELHVGLNGTMNALFLKDLAAKTRRGLEGRIRVGRSAGGLTFGYDVVQPGSEGEMRGRRAINPEQAIIVERIFREFASGNSPVSIARQLNAERVLGPSGRSWLDTTIRGHSIRGTGILRNELYIGKLIWNRLRYAKDPDTGRRLSRLNPKSEWVIEKVPELRIIEQALWARVAARLAEVRSDPVVTKRIQSRFWERRRPKYVTTGRVICGGCGKPMAVIGKDYLGCNFARRRGTCSSQPAIRRSMIENLIFDGLRRQLMAPELVKEFAQAFHKEINRQRTGEVAQHHTRRRELAAVNQQIKKLVDAIANGVRTKAIVDALMAAEGRKLEIEEALAKEPPTSLRLHPSLADRYQQRISDLHLALADPDLHSEAVEIVQSLIERIVVTNVPNGFEIELVGDLAAMINLAQTSAQENKKTALVGAALSAAERRSVKVVAGARFEPISHGTHDRSASRSTKGDSA
jgi:site-specific DNA recombinase